MARNSGDKVANEAPCTGGCGETTRGLMAGACHKTSSIRRCAAVVACAAPLARHRSVRGVHWRRREAQRAVLAAQPTGQHLHTW